MLKMKLTLLTLACTAFVAACGGGGGDETPAAPDDAVVGLWSGSVSTGASLNGVVLPDGAYWFIYSGAGDSPGLLQGGFSTSAGSFTLPNAMNYNAGLAAPLAFTASGSYSASAISGRTSYSNGNTDTFQISRQAGYDTPTTLASLQGSWRGTLGMVNGSIAVTIAVAADGSFTGSETEGCRFSGRFSLRPEAKAPVSLTLTLNPAFCDTGDTVTGVALPWSSGTQLVLGAQLPGRGNAVFGALSRNV
ncbi:hypothetical protein BurJ1DRAFT_1444 [Burkholderiales bacterium JOSHI_001]|nr:hypothetical protein BurJ1DRAFT_1444 [Burkholderiales bacterium JOSHI_001]